ncbi:MAG: hypothetical protein Q8O92_09480 [Candidatus Latescibacter sp.]|nr:hypothetical protein [Candidatus Latescibacter sp.]
MEDKKVKKGHCVNEKTLLVAIDLGKRRHYGYFRGPRKKKSKVFSIGNTLRESVGIGEGLEAMKCERGRLKGASPKNLDMMLIVSRENIYENILGFKSS